MEDGGGRSVWKSRAAVEAGCSESAVTQAEGKSRSLAAEPNLEGSCVCDHVIPMCERHRVR
jgi:hypothetical protein